MITEKQKMLSGQLYDSNDAELLHERLCTRRICTRYNALDPEDSFNQRLVLEELFKVKTNCFITPPFFCDYGYNISLGENAYFNFNCVILDVAKVTIGNNCFFGPGVQLYTATHPMDAASRRLNHEFAKSISIGDDVWMGGSVVVCPGVSIGSRTVIGAGSVVTRDNPAAVFAAGNPCRVIRNLQEV